MTVSLSATDPTLERDKLTPDPSLHDDLTDRLSTLGPARRSFLSSEQLRPAKEKRRLVARVPGAQPLRLGRCEALG